MPIPEQSHFPRSRKRSLADHPPPNKARHRHAGSEDMRRREVLVDLDRPLALALGPVDLTDLDLQAIAVGASPAGLRRRLGPNKRISIDISFCSRGVGKSGFRICC